MFEPLPDQGWQNLPAITASLVNEYVFRYGWLLLLEIPIVFVLWLFFCFVPLDSLVSGLRPLR